MSQKQIHFFLKKSLKPAKAHRLRVFTKLRTQKDDLDDSLETPSFFLLLRGVAARVAALARVFVKGEVIR